MLLSFMVSNFRSINMPITIDMLACPGDEKFGELPSSAGKKVLPVMGIFGPNASGKSSLLSAFNFLCNFVSGGLASVKNKGDLIPYDPFRFSSNASKEPTRFCVQFTVNNTIYEYALEHDAKCITHEHLYKWKSQRRSTIFIRNYQKFDFTKRSERLQRPLGDRTIENRPYLFSSSEWNLSATEDAFLWFRRIPRIDLDGSGWPYVFNRMMKDPEKKQMLLSYIKKADFNISDILKMETKEKGKKLAIKDLPDSLKELIVRDTNASDNDVIEFNNPPIFNTVHRIAGITTTFNLEEESRGTRKFLNVIGPAMDSFENGYVVFLDEFQNSLHPLLARRIIEMYQDPEINTGGAQLIFVSHDATLLDQTLLRQDQIMFTEKSDKDAETEAYRLSDIRSVGVKENILRGYLQGRYGAIPFLR